MNKTAATRSLLILTLTGMILMAFSCQAVKPYRRVYLNDDAMQMNKHPAEKFSSKVHTYREGASGGGRGKSSGGCGCN